LQPASPYKPHEQLINYITDRPGHDRRYDINTEKIASELGWEPGLSFEQGMTKTVQWYLDNPQWVQAIMQQSDYNTWVQRNYTERKG
jgi:dTDP-glucose 4,6-dehydratase